MRVLVIGASRGTGAAAVEAARRSGHEVTAFARSAPAEGSASGVYQVIGDVMDRAAVERAMAGQDAVIVTLGISDNPFGVRLRRRASTPMDVRSAGTATVIAAMQSHGIDRLVVQSTYGIGDGYQRLSLGMKVFFAAVLRPQIRDHERQEELVRASGLDWTVVRPAVLHDEPTTQSAATVLTDDLPGARISRSQLGEVLVGAIENADWIHRTVSVSEDPAAEPSGAQQVSARQGVT